MIDAQELRLGNLLSYNGNVVEVSSIGVNGFETHRTRGILYGSCDLEDYEPIPLTEQWLIDFGFKKGAFVHIFAIDYRFLLGNGYYLVIDFELGINVQITDMQGYPEGDSINLHSIETVHKLQNVVFALTGEELTKK